MPVFDKDGNEIPGGLTPEEAKDIQDQLAAEKAEREKLSAKDLNFERFRNKTEAEKQEILKKATETERMLLTEVEETRKEREAESQARMNEAKAQILRELAGADADMSKNIENQEKEFIGKALTPNELRERYIKAATLVKGKKPQLNQLNRFSPTSDYSSPEVGERKSFVEKEAGIALYEKMFGHKPGEFPKKK